MSYEYSEDGLVERATEEVLTDLGWQVVTAWKQETLGPKGLLGRDSKSEVILKRPLLAALKALNPGLPDRAYDEAAYRISEKGADKTLAQINKEKHELLTKGVQVSFKDAKGHTQSKRLRVFNFDEPLKNHFLAVRQFEVVGDIYNRRPDVVGFVNGVPLVFFELKAHHQDLQHAFEDNLKDYKDTIPHVLHCNAFVILSNGTDAKVGTVTSPYQYFLEWKRIEEESEGVVSLDTLLRGTCARERILDMFENFLLFDGDGAKPIKIMAKNHQYIGVNKVIDSARNIDELKGKLGVFWHTQGSGKSYSMVFLCQKILRRFGGGYTFLIVLDRSELERQIYDTFTAVGAVTEENMKAKSREHLRELLSENHRYVFTLIHKFSIDPKTESVYPLLSERSNIIVISDEAHRTQGGKFAQNMRFNALPNASFLGFTGTPLIKEELELTKNIFGEYVSVYDFKRAIEDRATLPLYYLNQGEKLDIERPELDERMAAIIEGEDLDDDQRAKLQREFARDYPVLTSHKRLDAIARDLVWHFNERGYQGKAMFVALDKPTAVKMYDLVMAYWPDYVAELKSRIAKAGDEQEAAELTQKLKQVEATEVCVVVSSEQNEVDKFRKMELEIAPHRKKMVERDLETEFKDEENPFRLAIVCAMWITGFDAPCVSTVYLDKPIKGHTLMQTIARANRVYDDEKENGLIVDYGNVYQKLREAYAIYGEGEGKKAEEGDGEDNNPDGEAMGRMEALALELAASIAAVREFLLGVEFELDALIACESPMVKLGLIKKAMNCVCLNETTRTTFEFSARDVFRKYRALYPETQIKPHIKVHNAIEAIYSQLNQKQKAADITSIIMKLQREVDDSIEIIATGKDDSAQVDLSKLDFARLRDAFRRSENQNTVVFDLQEAIEQRLEQMVRENPIRLEFYDRYRGIIATYNSGKDQQAVQKAFDDLTDFVASLSEEDQRAVREGLDQETLAIFDLLKKPNLSKKDEASVKSVAIKTLETLKAEKLRISKWRESTQVTAQVRLAILENLQYLPQDVYADDELEEKTDIVYQHIYATYNGSGFTPCYA
ncbi:type I restriction endonuclease subunit R [Rhizobium mesoamericanum]|uniref:Type I restriction enzyme endonuclease subunit n=1 Tax=Rhizobium mesoamericanum STM3625 TaxID=1211777 RepID=K0Q1X1_9HYPH|nr:type I restriction endonuclease subunit R [Rhizobium mesoamericanum]CCM78047.1 Type I site-specific deoxyribonuclease, HsdR family [Rhizobium mesoamericanum STM3625]